MKQFASAPHTPCISLSSSSKNRLPTHSFHELVEIYFRCENLLMPRRCTCRVGGIATAYVTAFAVQNSNNASIQLGRTTGVEIVSHDKPHHVVWSEPIRIVRLKVQQDPAGNNTIQRQLLQFAVSIGKIVLGLAHVELGTVCLSANRNLGTNQDTEMTFHLDTPGLGQSWREVAGRISERPRLILVARRLPNTPFTPPGMKPVCSVLDCALDSLRIAIPGSGIYKLKNKQQTAILDFRAGKRSRCLIYEPALGRLYYVSRNGDHQFEIIYQQPALHPKWCICMQALRFIFRLRKKTRAFVQASLLPYVGLTTPRFDEVAVTIWNGQQSTMKRRGSAGKRSRRSAQDQFATSCQTLGVSPSEPGCYLSVEVIPDFCVGIILDSMPSKMCDKSQRRELKANYKIFKDFVDRWREAERPYLKQVFKEWSGELHHFKKATPRRNEKSAGLRAELLRYMQSSRRAGYKGLKEAIQKASQVLNFDDHVLKAARLQQLNLWEYAQHTKARVLLNSVKKVLVEMCQYKLDPAERLSESDLQMHGQFHFLCVQVGWSLQVLKLLELVLRYKRMGLRDPNKGRNSSSSKQRLVILQNIRKHIQVLCLHKSSAPYIDESQRNCPPLIRNDDGKQVETPLWRLWKHLIDVREHKLNNSDEEIIDLDTVFGNLAQANNWCESVTSNVIFERFIHNLVSSTAQIIKNFKWTPPSDLKTDSNDQSKHSSDTTLKSLDGVYRLETCTPFHLNKDVMKQLLSIWEQHFKNHIPFEYFVSSMPQISRGLQSEALLFVAQAVPNTQIFLAIQKQIDDTRRRLSKRLASTVRYLLHPSSREKYRIVCKNGLMTDCLGKPLDTSTYYSNHAGAGFAIFSFHEAFGLFAASHIYMRFHHSSFFGGAPVHFAGEMKVCNGRLLVLTSKSGHYKPRQEQNHFFLRWLNINGFDLTHIEFRVVTQSGVEGEPHITIMTAAAQLCLYERDSTALFEKIKESKPSEKQIKSVSTIESANLCFRQPHINAYNALIARSDSEQLNLIQTFKTLKQKIHRLHSDPARLQQEAHKIFTLNSVKVARCRCQSTNCLLRSTHEAPRLTRSIRFAAALTSQRLDQTKTQCNRYLISGTSLESKHNSIASNCESKEDTAPIVNSSSTNLPIVDGDDCDQDDAESVQKWFRSIRLGNHGYANALITMGHDRIEYLSLVTEKELKTIGMLQGHIARFYAMVPPQVRAQHYKRCTNEKFQKYGVIH